MHGLESNRFFIIFIGYLLNDRCWWHPFHHHEDKRLVKFFGNLFEAPGWLLVSKICFSFWLFEWPGEMFFFWKDLDNWRPYWIEIKYSPPDPDDCCWLEQTKHLSVVSHNATQVVNTLSGFVVKGDKRFCVYLWSFAIYLVWGGVGRIGAISSRTLIKSSLIRTNHQNRGWTSADI